MTQEEYNKLCDELESRGYKQYPSITRADFAYFKGFGKSDYEEDRSNYQVCFDVYNFGKYADREPYFRTKPYGIGSMVLVSRTANELKEALANVPDDTEVYIDDGCSVTLINADNAEYDEYNNIFTIA